MAVTIPSKQPHTTHLDEKILVVKRTFLFPEHSWNGLEEVDMQEFLHLIQTRHEFHPRSLMEQDARYKQIIPYLIFRFADRYFLMQRKTSASEQRLANKYTLGIGGHIREEDMTSDSITDWAKREFKEEVNYDGSFSIKPLGILNDESNAVGQVHVGFVFLLEGNSPNIKVRSELKSGTLATIEQCKAVKDQMESWSQIVLASLAI